MDGKERRTYQRSSGFEYDAKVSADGRTWADISVQDLSSGGLQMNWKTDLNIGDSLWFELVFSGVFSQFEIRAEGVIRRKHRTHLYYVYGIAFINIPKDLKIRIDEAINQMRPREYLL